MDNVVVISHGEDIDGIASGALLKMKYGIPNKRIFYIDYSKQRLDETAEKLRKLNLKKPNLFITDLSVNDPNISSYLKIISMVKRKGGTVVWLDHHPWSAVAVKRVADKCDVAVNSESRMCATEIVIKHLKLKGSFINGLSKVTHCSDFNLIPSTKQVKKLVKTYALGIAYYNIMLPRAEAERKLLDLSKDISSGKMLNGDIVKAAKKFDDINEGRIKAMLKDLNLLGKNIAVAFSTGVQTTRACASIIDKSGRDIAIYINTKKGKGGIRSVNSNVTPLANSLTGGGHPHAAGFNFSMKKYNVNTRQGRVKLLKAIEKNADRLGLL